MLFHRHQTLWYPIGISGIVALTAFRPLSALVNAETGLPLAGVSLYRPEAYIWLAPFCTVYDMLTLLSLWQHVVLIGSILLLYAAWRVYRWRSVQLPPLVRLGHEVWRGGLCLGFLIGIYACGVLLPRPMSRLVLRDPDLAAIDFHSHTNASRDARRSFDAEANRSWHEAAGFNIVYVSDHRSLAGARAAALLNPRYAGEGTTLLQALEAGDEDEHIIALHVDTMHTYSARGMWHEPDYARASIQDLDASLLILSIPGNIHTVPGMGTNGHEPFYAVELSDGSPKGIAQGGRDRAQILRLANVLNLTLVAGSDNHGWGRTAVAWSVFRIPGWRQMTPAEVDAAIQHAIRLHRRSAGYVVARRSPDAGTSWFLLAATPITAVWTMARTLDAKERVSWVLWGWIVWGVFVFPLSIRRVASQEDDAGFVVDMRYEPVRVATAGNRVE